MKPVTKETSPVVAGVWGGEDGGGLKKIIIIIIFGGITSREN